MPCVGNAVKLKTMNILEIWYQQMFPGHRAAGLHLFVAQWRRNKSDRLANYFDLTLMIVNGGQLLNRLHGKRDTFYFHIVNFPFLYGNTPLSLSYGVNISQLIKYARCSSPYDDFRCRHKCQVDQLLSQFYTACRLRSHLRNFMADIEMSLRNTRGQSRTW